jgi:hypothetical protein
MKNDIFTDLPCHDCGVLPGQFHIPGCGVETCACCGGQAISCVGGLDGAGTLWLSPIPWSGRDVGVAECHECGFWCYFDPDRISLPSGARVPCEPDHPFAIEDLDRLRRECRWDHDLRKWIEK